MPIDDDARLIAAEQRIFAHGVIPFALRQGTTIEQLEQLADRLDARAAEWAKLAEQSSY